MSRIQFRYMFLLAAAIVIVCGVGPAQASIQLSLSNGNSAIAGYPGPYGTLTIDWVNSNTLNVSLTGDAYGSNFYKFGDGSTIALNLVPNGTIVEGDISSTWSTYKGLPNNLPAQVDGWGDFNFVLDSTDGWGDALKTVSFTVKGHDGAWTDEAHVLTTNPSGFLAAAHVFVPNVNNNAALATGYATNGDPIPEPTTIIIWSLFVGVGIVFGYWRKRKVD